ncbi:MAG: hypothetical protein OXI96_02180 [Acidimicrobiaceae bacterium]|nr:hypothetical protein [Acidimicrobiaceae bacterium]
MTNDRTLVCCLITLLTFGLIMVACGDDDAITDNDGNIDDSGAQDSDETVKRGGGRATLLAREGELAEVCPNPLVMQTDWFPESEYGALYHLIGDDYTVDVDSKMVSGSMQLNGVDLGINFEIRSGGPAIGNLPVATHMYIDDSIHLGHANTASQLLRWADTPLVSVLAPLEKNPQIIMWDPETYPEVQTLAELGDAGVTINVFSSSLYPDVFIAKGIWSVDQVDRSYDGSPARFIAEDGSIAQQGFASSEVYTYEHIHEEWGRPVAYQLLHDAGFESYSQTISVREDALETLTPCLRRVVPIMQQSVISYVTSPDRTNEMIVDAVERFESFWKYQPELADFSVQALKELQLVGNGSDSIVGNLDASRIQGVVDAILQSEIIDKLPDNFSVEDLYTNEFIDPVLGFSDAS